MYWHYLKALFACLYLIAVHHHPLHHHFHFLCQNDHSVPAERLKIFKNESL